MSDCLYTVSTGICIRHGNPRKSNMRTVVKIVVTWGVVGAFIATLMYLVDNFVTGTQIFKTFGATKPAGLSTFCVETPAPREWPSSQQDVWKPVIAKYSSAIFVFSAFLTPKHTIVISAMMRDFETRPRFFCQFWSEATEAGIRMTVADASLALSGETDDTRLGYFSLIILSLIPECKRA